MELRNRILLKTKDKEILWKTENYRIPRQNFMEEENFVKERKYGIAKLSFIEDKRQKDFMKNRKL